MDCKRTNGKCENPDYCAATRECLTAPVGLHIGEKSTSSKWSVILTETGWVRIWGSN